MVELQAFFFPALAQGHMIPMLDMAKLFASRGVHSTIITTPLNAHVFAKAVAKSNNSGFQMSIKIINFPEVTGLPVDCENADQITSSDMFVIFINATIMLKEQVEQLLEEYRPNCLVAHMFMSWAIESAAKFDIPALFLRGSSFFVPCAARQVRLLNPFKNLTSGSDEFVVLNLPHKFKLCLSQFNPDELVETETKSKKMISKLLEPISRSYGMIVNSIYELEPDYVDHYKNVFNRRVWNIGPLSLCNSSLEEKAERGKKAAIDENECLKWLESKKPNSVLYICFGSVSKFPSHQLHEIAMGVEASGQQFIWVIRNDKDEEFKEWMPEGFEERMEGKGLILRGWAPQVLILDHEAIGGFVTHCGWNSTLEGITAGVPMVTWPSFAEQFYTEKFITEILQIGVAVGAKEWVFGTGGGNIKREAVEMAVKSIMVGEEAEERRKRAKGLKEMAKKAVEEGGSSYLDLNALIQELSLYHSSS